VGRKKEGISEENRRKSEMKKNEAGQKGKNSRKRNGEGEREDQKTNSFV
jgi:hypothetical protein